MIKLKKALVLFLSLFCYIFLLSSEENNVKIPKLEDLFSEQIVQKLKEKKELRIFNYETDTLKVELAPNTITKTLIENLWTKEEEPLLSVEALYYVTDVEKQNNDKIRQIIQSVSKMEGIEYYSNRKEKYEILYKKNYCIDNVQDKNKVPDKIDDKIDGKKVLILQDDNSFGEYASNLEYFEKGNDLGFVCTNVEDISILFFKGAKKEDLKIFLMIENLGEELVLYSRIVVDFPKYPTIEKFMKNSLSARLDAITKWFIDLYIKKGDKI